jgi:hypothetical protein
MTIKRLLKKNLVDLLAETSKLVDKAPKEDETKPLPETELVPHKKDIPETVG